MTVKSDMFLHFPDFFLMKNVEDSKVWSILQYFEHVVVPVPASNACYFSVIKSNCFMYTSLSDNHLKGSAVGNFERQTVVVSYLYTTLLVCVCY